jgi:hypothetical protein
LLAECRPCSGEALSGKEAPSGCTVFTVAKGDRVFFGGNDDSIHPDSFYWVEPGWAAGILWAIVVGGALLGWLLLTLYQSWAVRRGLSA